MVNREHRVLILGGGVAGLDVATHLAGKRTRTGKLTVTLVDREPAYVWKPMLHTIAAGTSESGMQQTVYAAHALNTGFEYQLGDVVSIDRKHKTIHLAPIEHNAQELVPARTLEYDTLVLAVGSRANDFGTPGVEEHCARIDSRSEAIAFNDTLRVMLVKAAATQTVMTVGIVGGGATGVELAAELIQIASTAEQYGLAGAAKFLRVVLIESGPRLLGPFPDEVARGATARLLALGVEIRLGVRVSSVDATGFDIEGGATIGAQLKVWAAGVKAPGVVGTLDGLKMTRTGQLVVDRTLRAPGDSSIFALGDCASLQLEGATTPVPTTAQAAYQQAVYLSTYLPRILAGEKVPSVSFRDFGSLVSLGGYGAYGSLGRFGFFSGKFIRGRVAQLGHALLYRKYQVRIHGICKGSLLWLIDVLGRSIKPGARLS